MLVTISFIALFSLSIVATVVINYAKKKKLEEKNKRLKEKYGKIIYLKEKIEKRRNKRKK
jgi:hypothetical protein